MPIPKKNSVCIMILSTISMCQQATAATLETPTTAFFEKINISPRNTAQLRDFVRDKTLSFKEIYTNTVQHVYYGTLRIDDKGQKSKYKISKSAIEEEHDGQPRLVLLYDWKGKTFACLQNVGDLDVLGDLDGACPYEIVDISSGDRLDDFRGK